MSAAILPFPCAHGVRLRCRTDAATALAPVIERQWSEQHLPLIRAALDLLEADDADFEDRCRQMLDAEGMSLLDDLCGQLAKVGEMLGAVSDAVALTRTRVRTAMCRLRPSL